MSKSLCKQLRTYPSPNPTKLARPSGIYPHMCVNTWSVIGSLSFSNIYTILHNVTLYVLMSVLVSYITLPQLSNLKSKKLSIFNGRNPHLFIDHIMLIYNFPCNCIHYSATVVCFVQSAFCYTL